MPGRKTAAWVLALLPWLAWQASDAEPAVPPAAPSVAFAPTPHDIDHYWEYFYFHKTGVTYDGALADLKECQSYSAMLVATGPVPKFVALGGRPRSAYSDEDFYNWYRWYAQYGIVGGFVSTVIFAIAANSVNHGVERANTRRCMSFKGYRRYGLSNTLWKQLNKGTDEEIVTRFAAIASGPAPQNEAIDP